MGAGKALPATFYNPWRWILLWQGDTIPYRRRYPWAALGGGGDYTDKSLENFLRLQSEGFGRRVDLTRLGEMADGIRRMPSRRRSRRHQLRRTLCAPSRPPA